MYPYIQCTAVASIIIIFSLFFQRIQCQALNELEHHQNISLLRFSKVKQLLISFSPIFPLFSYDSSRRSCL